MKKILFVASEAVPFVSSGGLGDVMGSLPQYMAKNDGYEICVALPMYSLIDEELRRKFTKLCEYTVNLAWRKQYCGIYTCMHNNVRYYFIDNEYYFRRNSVYGNFDDAERYAFFCMACLEIFRHVGYFPDIIHANDWQSALTVIYLKTLYAGIYEYRNIKALYTIHNIEYQGKFDMNLLWDVFGICNEHRSTVEYGNEINLSKGAIVCCDLLTTVSDRYSTEIQTDYFGCGLAGIIKENAYKCRGIINGIDTERYSPQSSEVVCKYSFDNTEGKKKCKEHLQKLFGLKVSDDIPVIAMVSRLAGHKGFDLVKHVADELLREDVQFVLLGTGEKSLEDYFRYLEDKYKGKAAVRIGFDKELSQKIYSGSDMFLMPSRSEPCGLSQMIAARYGTVPIVHGVGGLYDSITPFDENTLIGNGFTFGNYNAHEMLFEVKKAIALYGNKMIWNKITENAMLTDFSWELSAKKYHELYSQL